MKKSIKYFLTLIIFFPAMSFGQKTLNVLDLHHDSSIPLRERIIEATAELGTFPFHSKTGGVAFEAVAKPVEELSGKQISLDYANNTFTVTVGGKTYYPTIPDWQLVPTVKFADSNFNVAFSSLGDTVGNRQAQLLYHPAFINTLAGLRIFQADLLNIPGVLWDLPKDDSENYILAASEKNYIPTKDTVLNGWLYDALCGEGRPFSSYILTDRDADIAIETEDGYLRLSGNPYYFFTKSNIEKQVMDSLITKVQADCETLEDNAKVLLGNEYSQDLNPRINLSGLRRKIEENKDKAPSLYYKIKSVIAELDSVYMLNEKKLGIEFKTLDAFTASFGRRWTMLKRYNPAVYSALEDISQWTAFFRYVKLTNPENWQKFVRKTDGRKVSNSPSVQTPTSFEIDYIRIFKDRVKRQEIY
ncbi:MAG: hypothetical protein LBJ17_09500 [Dysgonamonadaceae bacterium]|jgi:hypothetical protein|nr:hypothetical protein [Dysgonamonadaceae bacterium]